MTTAALHVLRPAATSAWDQEVEAYRAHLATEGKSPRTVQGYLASLRTFAGWLQATGRPTDPQAVTRQDAKAFAADQVARLSANTARTRIINVSTFYKWLVEEWTYSDHHARSPFDGVTPPAMPKVHVPILTDGQVDALLAACSGRSFEDLRDRAILALVVSTGLRRSEAAALQVADVDLIAGTVHVHQGKGGRDRWTAFGPTASVALRHYLRARAGHASAGLPDLWLVIPGHGQSGAFGQNGLAAMATRRGRQAGLGALHLHQLRHTWTDRVLVGGMPEGAVMRLAGWRTRDMLDRYGAAGADQRALQAYVDPLARRRR